MPTKREIIETNGFYFLTITCYRWLPLFQLGDAFEAVYHWFDHLKTKGHFVCGYVIMPNHLHALIGFRHTTQSINLIVGNGKRFMAYEIVERFKKKDQIRVLEQLSAGVIATDKRRGKLHQVWKDSFDWKECRTTAFANQKLGYIHSNPCRGKWQLAKAPVEYLHSSMRFYIDEQGIYPVTNFMELMDIDLSKPS